MSGDLPFATPQELSEFIRETRATGCEYGLGMSADEMHSVFAEWNQGDLDSYLVEISRDILAKKDEDGQQTLLQRQHTARKPGLGQPTKKQPPTSATG